MLTKQDIFMSTNLELAFQRFKTSPRHIHKNLYWSAFKEIEPHRAEYFEFLKEKFSITDRVDNPGIARVYLPKKGGFVRPITYIGFEAFLIYQAIANKLIEFFYNSISKNYNKITFGNHFSADFNSPFPFLQWKQQWKRYQKISQSLIEDRGFNYVLDFDIASFYDSIDHKLLMKCLKGTFDDSVADIFISILKLSHSDFAHINPGSGSGIPQGPIASIIISEIFLDYYIDQYFLKQMRQNEIEYIRYADDIRVFSQSKAVAKKFVTLLDLLCRNSGLIPQSLKVGMNFYENSKELVDQDIKKFSQIQKKYKKTGKLKSRVSRKAMNSIKEMFKKGKFDKTRISFFLYKLDKDDELRDLILTNITNYYEFCDPMLFYLRQHYADDENTINKLIDLFIVNESFFLDYPIYSFLDKFYPHISFSTENFLKLYNKKNKGKWLSKIPFMKWAIHFKQKDVLLSLNADEIENFLLRREVLVSQYLMTSDSAVKKQLEKKLMDDEHVDLSFKAISLIYKRLLFNDDIKYSYLKKIKNPIVDKIILGNKHNLIADTLQKQGVNTNDPDSFFNDKIFFDENEFFQLSVLSNFVVNYFKDKDYKLFIDSLDQFNHIVIERLFCLKKGNRPKEKYGALLENESFLSREMVGVRDTLKKIHQLRNGELHPKDIKTGKFHSGNKKFKQKVKAMEKLFPLWIDAIEEILAWHLK